MTPIRRVVVTGGSGRVGRYVLEELGADYDLLNADLQASSHDVEFARVDVTDLNALRTALTGADAVCHLAGIDYDRPALAEDHLRVNALGSWNVVRAAAEAGVRNVVLMSSVAASGLSEMRPDWQPQYLPVDELHEPKPVASYGVSKLVVEQIGQLAARDSGLAITCFRTVHVLTDDLHPYLQFIDAPGRRWLFYYVTGEDVARAFRLALESPRAGFGVFYLSAADTSRKEPTLEWYPERVGSLPRVDHDLYEANPRAAIFGSRAAATAIGWAPTSDFLALRSELRRGSPAKGDEPDTG
jgi:nucleoside-diphosphate-sugar epimerase